MLKKLLSYFLPINVFSTNSDRSKTIEINWNNGELVLDSKNTNYSYGSLQRILKYGLQHIGTNSVGQMKSICVLGIAGGSVVKTLIKEFNFKGDIIGVEIDSAMIAIANTYFDLDKIPTFKIINDDAFNFVFSTKLKFDLIIIDVFEDTSMPTFLFEKHFINQVIKLLNSNGTILFNTMILNSEHNRRNKAFLHTLISESCDAYPLPRLEYHNELLVIKK